MIKSVWISAFKSFGAELVKIELEQLNVIVGANASGKSKFLQALEFLATAANAGLPQAVAALGGGDQVLNRIAAEQSETRQVTIGIEARHRGDFDYMVQGPDDKEAIMVDIPKFTYEISFDPGTAVEGPVVISEVLEADVKIERGRARKLRLVRDKSTIEIRDPIGEKSVKGGTRKAVVRIAEQELSSLAIGSSFFSLPITLIRQMITSWKFFAIDPDAARAPCVETPNPELQKDGSNLAGVLKQLESPENSDKKRSIELRMRNIVPGFKTWRTETIPFEAKRAFQIFEDKSKSGYAPMAVSNGTIRVLAILVIAEWLPENAHVIGIEEPEIGLHPHVTEQVAEVLTQASEHAQVFVTTHNPDFLDFVEPESVILCDETEGVTLLQRASDSEQIQEFKKHYSLGELWTQGAIGGIP